MQFKITFKVLKPGQNLPLSYQYELSSWIYHRIGDANHEFAQFLHNEGYVEGHKRFKFFTFSNLWVPPMYEIQGDRMKVMSSHISLVLSFLVPQAAQEMILGIFKQQSFRLGDKISGLDLQVQSIEILKPHEISTTCIQLRTTSPLLISKQGQMKGGKIGHQYLSPLDSEYEGFFLNNLQEKHRFAVSHGLAEKIKDDAIMRFRLISSQVKKRLIRIKAHTPGETRIAGYIFDFELEAPKEMIRTSMLAGFGGENALGFGAVRTSSYKSKKIFTRGYQAELGR